MIRKFDIGTEVGFGWVNRKGEVHLGGKAHIARVNGFGHIALDNNLVFDKSGANRGQTNYRLRLLNPKVAEKPVPDPMTKEWKNVDLALKITALITGNFTTQGQFPVTEDLKREILDHLAEMQV